MMIMVMLLLLVRTVVWLCRGHSLIAARTAMVVGLHHRVRVLNMLLVSIVEVCRHDDWKGEVDCFAIIRRAW